MSKHDFDTFKQHLREWMESHSGEYDAFEAGMNRRDDAGYQMVLAMAMGLAPEYEKIVSQRINRGPDGDISEIERLFSENGLAETLTGDSFGSGLTANMFGDFEDIRKESIVPAMLCWLYFGQSFERMVERGEELRRSPEIPYHEKMLVAQTIAVAMKTLGYVNQFGRGIETVQEELETNKNGAADFKFDDITTFKVIVANADPDAENEAGVGEVSEKNVGEVSEKRVGEKMTERQATILRHIEQSNVVSAKEIAALMQIADRTIERDIQKLKNMQILERIGGDRGGYWKIKR